MGVWGCFEVTIGKERVDYMTLDTKGVWRCYEVKVSKADFHSRCAKTFVGHYNYYVMPKELYEAVKDEIPDGIGVTNGVYVMKHPKRRELGIDEDTLKTCMLRSLWRDADKLYETENPYRLDEIKTEARNARKEAYTERMRHNKLMNAVVSKYGINELYALCREDEEGDRKSIWS